MKKFVSVLMIATVLILQMALPFSGAYAEGMYYDSLYEQGMARGNNVPSKSTTLPYTGSWNSVVNYTNSNYYFTGVSKVDISIKVAMNNYDTSGRFKVYLIDMDKENGDKLVLDSGDTTLFSYTDSTTVSIDSSHRYYFKFKISNNSKSCWGSITVEKSK